MTFGQIEEDAYQEDLGFSMGTMGRSSSGKIRGPPVDAKTKARISKTLQQKLNKQNQTWGGSTSVKKQVLILYEFLYICFVYVAFLIWKFCIFFISDCWEFTIWCKMHISLSFQPCLRMQDVRCTIPGAGYTIHHPRIRESGIPSNFLFCKNTNSQHCGWQTRHLGQRQIP